ncbi:50S ribosomal protein L22 [Labeo rohita]|uniref:50S ribosomal protein L22 n=1 Tax=Labeo rohita TaxID=84645 RepID=A0ABQ8MX72_LABRO|nr:50S ribosomal protein L22 [Labeo rohita]
MHFLVVGQLFQFCRMAVYGIPINKTYPERIFQKHYPVISTFYPKYTKYINNRPITNRINTMHRNEANKGLLICNTVRKRSVMRFTNQRAAFCLGALVTAKTCFFETTNHDRRFRHLNWRSSVNYLHLLR